MLLSTALLFASGAATRAGCAVPPKGPTHTEPPVTSITRVAPDTPTLKLSGSTTGSGSAAAGWGVRVGISDEVVVSLSGSGSIASTSGISTLFAPDVRGTSNLFSAQQNAPPESYAWKLGFLLGLSWSRLQQSEWEEKRRDAIHCEAYGLCGGKDAHGKDIDGSPSNLNASDFCSEGGKLILEKEADARDFVQYAIRKYRYPLVDLSLWGGFGRSKFNYFETLTAQRSTMPSPNPVYGTTSSTRGNSAFAIEAVYVDQSPHDYAFTLELPITIQSTDKAASDIAQACTSLGTYNQAPLLNCDQAPVGPPTRRWTEAAAFGLGVVDKKNGAWRAALTPAFSYSSAQTSSSIPPKGGVPIGAS